MVGLEVGVGLSGRGIWCGACGLMYHVSSCPGEPYRNRMSTDFALPNVRVESAFPVPEAACTSSSRNRSLKVSPNSESAPAWIKSRREMPSHSFRLLPRIRRMDMDLFYRSPAAAGAAIGSPGSHTAPRPLGERKRI